MILIAAEKGFAARYLKVLTLLPDLEMARERIFVDLSEEDYNFTVSGTGTLSRIMLTRNCVSSNYFTVSGTGTEASLQRVISLQMVGSAFCFQ